LDREAAGRKLLIREPEQRGMPNAWSVHMVGTVIIGFILFIVLGIFSLAINPPSAWIGKRNSD